MPPMRLLYKIISRFKTETLFNKPSSTNSLVYNLSLRAILYPTLRYRIYVFFHAGLSPPLVFFCKRDDLSCALSQIIIVHLNVSFQVARLCKVSRKRCKRRLFPRTFYVPGPSPYIPRRRLQLI
jgi:hypothetical protein